MSNFLDELAIAIKVNTEGVKKGIDTAISYTKSYQKQIQDLQNEIKLKFDQSGIKELQNTISDLNKRKEELQSALKINVDSSEIDKLKNEIASIDLEIKNVKVNVEDDEAKQKLKELENKKLALQKEINSKVKIDLENKDKISKEIDKIEKEIKNLERNVQIKLEESGINKAKTELNSLNDKLQETEAINKSLDSSFLALGITATAIFASIVTAMNKGTEAYIQYTNAMSGLRSQMEFVGEDMSKATEMMKELTQDGLISESDVAMSIKNLTIYGYSLEQANDILLRLKDSASYNRQAHYELGEAVRVTTEGIRNENSILSDASGVTKNIAKMYEEYAQSIGKSSQNLTQAEKATAVYNGIMAETEAVVGNATKYGEQLGGVMAEQSAQALKLQQAFGSALAPAVKDITIIFTSLTKGLAEFINENNSLVAGITTGTTALTLMATALIAIKKGVPIIKSLITSLNTAKVSATGFTTALGPIGIALTAISVGIGIFTSIRTEIEKTKEAQKALNEEVEKFNSLMLEATTENNISLKVLELEGLEQAKKDLEEMLEYYKNNNVTSLTTGISLEKAKFDTVFTKELGKTEDDLLNFKASLEKCGIEFNDLFDSFDKFIPDLDIFDEKIKEITLDVNGFSESLDFQVSLEEISSAISTLDSLSSACDKLASGEKLTSAELSKLIAQYPIIAEHIANTGDLTLEKGEIVRQVIDEEIASQKKAMETEQERIEKAIEETKKQIELKEQLKEIQTGNSYDKTAKEIENLQQRLKEYEEQNISAKSAVAILNEEISKIANEKLLSGLKGLQGELSNLEQAYETLVNGERLSYEQVKSLIDIYPELQNYISKTGDITFNSGQVILQVINNIKKAYDDKRESLIANSKAEIKAIEEEINAITSAYEQERLSIIQLMKARQELYKNGTGFIGPLKDEQFIAQYTELLNNKKYELENSIKEIELMGNIAKSSNSSSSSLSSSGSLTISNQTTELEKQLDIYNKLKETTEMSSREQLEYLESLRTVYAKTAEDFDKINTLIYSARKQANDDWYEQEIEAIKKLNKGREDNTDFQAIINEYYRLIEEMKIAYSDYPETLKKLIDDVNSYILDATASRNQKLYNLELENLNNTISIYEEHISILKKLDGLEVGGETLKFTNEDEKNILSKVLDEITEKLNEFVDEKGDIIKNMTDDEKAYYENLLSLQKTYSDKYIDATINTLKDIQEAEKTANEERLKSLEETLNNQTDLAKEKSKEYIEAIKERYAEEIELAKNAANEEIAIYEQRIKEIESILKQDERNERDDDILDKIKRTEEQLKYEVNEVNRYELEKEIERLKAEYEINLKKDSLEDEKDRLKEEINAIKESNSQRVEELQKMRDYEIEQVEKMLENYITALEERLEKEKLTNLQATEDLKNQLDVRLSETLKMYNKKETYTRNNVNNEARIIESGTNNIINMLRNYESNFYSLGSRWGEALANAFNNAIDRVNFNIPSISDYSFDSYSNGRMVQGQNITNYYNMEQTITAPVASPSRVRRETEQMLRSLSYL